MSSSDGVAGLELCQKLYDLSKWDDCSMMHDTDLGEPVVTQSLKWTGMLPAYDLGYLLRKLPPSCPLEHVVLPNSTHDLWHILWMGRDKEGDFPQSADTPEDAACKLAIELIKQKVITP